MPGVVAAGGPGKLLVGASLTGVRVRFTVAVSVAPPLVTVYVKLVAPLKLLVGTKSSVPSGFSVTLPLATATLIRRFLNDSGLPNRRRSLLRRRRAAASR